MNFFLRFCTDKTQKFMWVMDDDVILNFDYLSKVINDEKEDVTAKVDELVYCSTVMRNQFVWTNEGAAIIGKWSYNHSSPGANYSSNLNVE